MYNVYVGVGMFLKEKNPAIKVVLADPQVRMKLVCIHCSTDNVCIL